MSSSSGTGLYVGIVLPCVEGVACAHMASLSPYFDELDACIEKGDIEEARSIIRQLEIYISGETDRKKRYDLNLRLHHCRCKLRGEKPILTLDERESKRTSVSTLEKLEQARRQLLQTEQIAAETMDHLRAQREVLSATKGKMDEVKGELHESDTWLRRLSRWWRG